MQNVEWMEFTRIEKFLKTLSKGGFRDDHIEQIIEGTSIDSRILFKLYKKYLKDEHTRLVSECFELIKTISITVPSDYPIRDGSETFRQIEEYLIPKAEELKIEDGFHKFLSEPTLLPGQKFDVKIFKFDYSKVPCSTARSGQKRYPHGSSVTISADFCRIQKSSLLKGEGLLLMKRLAEKKLPNMGFFYSVEDVYRHNCPDETPCIATLSLFGGVYRARIRVRRNGIDNIWWTDEPKLPQPNTYLVCFIENKRRK